MDLKMFLEELNKLKKLAEELFYYVEEKEIIKSKKLDDFLIVLEKLVPQINFFTEQTQIGDKNWLNIILKDLEFGIVNEDIILFTDALCNGIESLVCDYINIITEAIYE